MSKRYEQQYKTRRGDNLGDPEWHNRRWDDIDRRMHQRELDSDKVDNAVDQLTAIALERLNDSFAPVIAEAIDRLQDLSTLFVAHSISGADIILGPQTFILTVDTRLSFVPFDYVAIHPTLDPTIGMTARVLSLNRESGAFEIDTEVLSGAGTYFDWHITIAANPDIGHAGRTDNPHATTAAQVGAWPQAVSDTRAQDYAAGAAATATEQSRALIIGTAPGTLNTLGKIAAAIGNNPTFANNIQTQIAANVEFNAGTAIVFSQAAAPTGWATVNHNDKVLRIVNANGGGVGGVYAFSTAFGYRTSDGTALGNYEMTQHVHGTPAQGWHLLTAYSFPGFAAGGDYGMFTTDYATYQVQTNYAGSTGPHSHSLDMRVQYVDAIICRKN